MGEFLRRKKMTEKRRNFSGTLLQSPSAREIAHGKFARELAARGIVLLKNEALLPFKENEEIALQIGRAHV